MQVISPTSGWLMLAVFGIAFGLIVHYATRRTLIDKDEYLVASRKVGLVRGAFSISATWIWAPALFVAAAQGYMHGWVGVFWFSLFNILVLAMYGWFAKHIREQFPEGYTISAVTRERYSSRTQLIYAIAFVAIGTCGFAVQLLAGGLVVSALTGIPFWMITVALALIVLGYSLRSGLAANIVTDWLQMWIIGLVTVGLAVTVVYLAGWGTFTDGLGGISGEYSSLITGAGGALFWTFGIPTSIAMFSGPFVGQTYWQRTFAMRKDRVAPAFYLAAVIFAIVPLGMGIIGITVAGAGLPVDDPQLTNLAAVLNWMPLWVVVPFLLYVFSGLASSLSSMLAAVSSVFGHDAVMQFGGSYEDSLKWARRSMIVLTVGGIAIANLPGLTILSLWFFYGTIRAAITVPSIAMILSRRPLHEPSVFWGILVSLAVWLPVAGYAVISGGGMWQTYSLVGILAFSGTATLLGSRIAESRGLLTRPQPNGVPVEAMETDGRV